MITIWKVRALLADRGIAPDRENDFQLQDNSDGEGPFIAKWIISKLGPKPSEADLDTFKTQADALQAEAAKNPNDELASAISEAIKDEPPGSPVRKLGEALLGQAGGKARVAGRPV